MDHSNRIAPPEGIEIAEECLEELRQKCAALKTVIDALSTNDLLPDVVIYYNAVQYAIEQSLFYEEEDVDNGSKLIDQGMARAESLKAGESPWTEETGLVVRGYRSRIDDSVQPYGLVVPETYSDQPGKARRLDIWHHGRNAKGSELRFLVERQTEPGRFTPHDTFVLHTYGRYSNAMKFAGETDTFEALDHAKTQYAVDPDRICMRGFSMGGAATWHLSTHYAGDWVAATPGAGFAETAIYQNVAAKEEQPPWWEQKLWAMYDATKVAGNLRQCPTIAYSGENDKQMQASDIMAEYMKEQGLDLPHIIGKGMGHAYDDASKDEIERRLADIVTAGKDRVPKQIRLTTYTLKYNRILWVQVDGLESHWERAQANAEINGEGVIEAETSNVSALTLDFGESLCPIDVGTAVRVEIDGDTIGGPEVDAEGAWSIHLIKQNGSWSAGRLNGLRKVTGLQGPIDDAFMGSFLMVQPSGDSDYGQRVIDWVERERTDALYQWKMQFRGDARSKLDLDVSDEDLENHNLVLWGDPSSNRVLSRILGDLPLTWDTTTVRVREGDARPADRHVPAMIYPNPLNPERYVVLNSGFTFAPNGSQSNSTQTPKLPDWAILDVDVDAGERLMKGVVDCGFFDERWQPKATELTC